VIYKSVPDADIPVKLSKLQFVRFDTAPGMMRPLRELTEALRVDLDWIREHTRLAELATRWQSRNRPDSLLLRGDDVNAAKAWVAKRKPDAPAITDIQRTFLSASEHAEGARLAELKAARSRLRRTQFLFSALVALIVLGGAAAYWNEQSLRGFYHWLAHVRGFVLTAQAERMLNLGDTFLECVTTDGDYSKYCPEMVVVPAGEFIMGSPATETDRNENEGPQHEVAIVRSFAVSKFEVTFDQWDACVQSGGCNLPGAGGSPWGRGKQPAINVSWDDAEQYVQWLSWHTGKRYRLLTEAEWEYAARAGSTGPYSFEGDALALGEYAWYSENSGYKTNPVGEKKSNAFGLYDVHGNVYEWVEDCYHKNYDGAPTDGAAWTNGDCSDRVIRSGSWLVGPQFLRTASRYYYTSGARTNLSGFRVARTLLPP
jgi:formylglycine-generating enzyme required for sulfatase activity